MRRVKLLSAGVGLVVALAVAPRVDAQQTTTCNRTSAQTTTCMTYGPKPAERVRAPQQPQYYGPPPAPYAGDYSNAPTVDIGAIMRRNKARKLQKKVGALLAEGKCDEGVKLALSEGDFDLADRARDACPAS